MFDVEWVKSAGANADVRLMQENNYLSGSDIEVKADQID